MRSKVFVVATRHARYATDKYPKNSVVIDPWRYVEKRDNVTVRRLGENKPETISLLLPSRGRPTWLHRMMFTALETAIYPRSVEIVVYVDEDDPEREAYLRLPWVKVKLGPRIVLSEMWNDCFQRSTGNIVMHCGDDVVFKTPGWDEIVRKEFEKYPDKLVFLYGDDLGPNGQVFGTHGFMHRRWAEIVGYFVPPLFSSDWNDVWLNEVADMIGRKVLIPIVTEHLHYTFGKAPRDQTHHDP